MPKILVLAEYFKNCSETSVSNPLEKMILYFKSLDSVISNKICGIYILCLSPTCTYLPFPS